MVLKNLSKSWFLTFMTSKRKDDISVASNVIRYSEKKWMMQKPHVNRKYNFRQGKPTCRGHYQQHLFQNADKQGIYYYGDELILCS